MPPPFFARLSFGIVAKKFNFCLIRPQYFVPLGTRVTDMCPGELEARRQVPSGLERHLSWAMCSHPNTVLTSVRTCFKPFLLTKITYKSHWLIPTCLIVRECEEWNTTTAHSWIGARSRTAPAHDLQAGHCGWNIIYSSRQQHI